MEKKERQIGTGSALVSVGLLIIYGIFSLVKVAINNNKETQYCGKVVKVYMTSAGYKVSSENHIVFYNDSLKRNVDVRVTNQTYVNTKEGQFICFDLNRMQLEE